MSDLIIGRASERDPARLPLETKNRTPILNEQHLEWSPGRLEASVKIWKHARPCAELRSITATYNCVGMVFASRRTFIGSDQIHFILENDDYEKLDGPEMARIGDIVVYTKGGLTTHVGIIVDTVLSVRRVMSKWGAEGEYIHPERCVPELYGDPTEYWSDRKSTDG